MKKVLVPLMLGFGVVLAVIVGQRLSTDAMAVVLGVAVGVIASVPTSLLLVALLRRERQAYRPADGVGPPPPYGQLPYPQQPNIIVLDPTQLLAQRQGQSQPPYVPLPPPHFAQDGGVHRLRVVGSDEEL